MKLSQVQCKGKNEAEDEIEFKGLCFQRVRKPLFCILGTYSIKTSFREGYYH